MRIWPLLVALTFAGFGEKVLAVKPFWVTGVFAV